MNSFAQFARAKRERAGLSQEVVAKALGYGHRSNIHRLEAGKLEWKLVSVIKLAHLLRTSASNLLAEWENQNRREK